MKHVIFLGESILLFAQKMDETMKDLNPIARA